MNLKNVVKQKRCTRVIFLGAEKISTIKNQNWRCGIHIEKIPQITLQGPKKAFFSISYFEKCLYMQSLPTANFSLVWPNFCTPYWTPPPPCTGQPPAACPKHYQGRAHIMVPGLKNTAQVIYIVTYLCTYFSMKWMIQFDLYCWTFYNFFFF